jgi:hypothetical protein
VYAVEQNYVENSSFEDGDISMWRIVADGTQPTELAVQEKKGTRRRLALASFLVEAEDRISSRADGNRFATGGIQALGRHTWRRRG